MPKDVKHAGDSRPKVSPHTRVSADHKAAKDASKAPIPAWREIQLAKNAAERKRAEALLVRDNVPIQVTYSNVTTPLEVVKVVRKEDGGQNLYGRLREACLRKFKEDGREILKHILCITDAGGRKVIKDSPGPYVAPYIVVATTSVELATDIAIALEATSSASSSAAGGVKGRTRSPRQRSRTPRRRSPRQSQSPKQRAK